MLFEDIALQISGYRSSNFVRILPVLLVVLCAGIAGCTVGGHRVTLPSPDEVLLFRAAAAGDVNEVKRLLDRGININAREEEQETPLMYAAAEGKTEVVELLIARGADINALSVNGETALARAVGRRSLETVALLLDRGADIEKAASGGGTPLMYAAGNSDLEMVKLLLSRGAKINAVDDEGYTALACVASREGQPEAARLLLSAGADRNIRTKRNETPLMIAEQNGDQDLISVLKDGG